MEGAPTWDHQAEGRKVLHPDSSQHFRRRLWWWATVVINCNTPTSYSSREKG
ncbi:hypothetical protein OH492_22755 [Vibrio chagasii]|nr:hypothetical protein [Vibrio chagasii]